MTPETRAPRHGTAAARKNVLLDGTNDLPNKPSPLDWQAQRLIARFRISRATASAIAELIGWQSIGHMADGVVENLRGSR